MYTMTNYRTKKALKDAVMANEQVRVFQPGPFGSKGLPRNGQIALEGPHYPEPHRWYASATLKDGLVVKVT